MQELQVNGMSCAHCVAAVTRAVQTVPGAGAVAVDLARGRVTVAGTPDRAALRQAIIAEGYEVEA